MGSPGPPPTTTLGDTLAVFEQLEHPYTPLTASEVAEELSCTRRTAFNKLQALSERGDLNSKKPGARSRVWWWSDPSGRATAADGVEVLDDRRRSSKRGRNATDPPKEERELEEQRERYQGLLEAAPVAIAIFDTDGRLRYVNDAAVDLVGADSATDLLGESAMAFVHPEDQDEAIAGLQRVLEARETTETTELRLVGLDGQHGNPIHAMVTSVPITFEGEPASQTVLVDITDQKERQRQLTRQRQRIDTLNQLNGVVRETTHAVIESSTRDEIENLVCDRLAATDAYRFAWVGSIDREGDRVRLRTSAGVEESMTDLFVRFADTQTPLGPTAQAAQTGDIHVAQRLRQHAADEPWPEYALEQGARSVAAIPIEYEDAIFGILTIGSGRPTGFDPDESEVIVRLGEVVGHALTTIERRRALVSEEAVELRLRIHDLFEGLDVSTPDEDAIFFDRTVLAGEDTVLSYGTGTESAVETLKSLVDQAPHFESVRYVDGGTDEVRFELTLSPPSAISVIASYGGRIDSVHIEDADFDMVVHVSTGTDIRTLVEAVRDGYPDARVVAQRRRTRTNRGLDDTGQFAGLTERQLAVLEAAYYAGFFESPRASTGEELADSLGISPSTFHQHVRLGERKLVRALFEGEATGRTTPDG